MLLHLGPFITFRPSTNVSLELVNVSLDRMFQNMREVFRIVFSML